MDLLDAFRLGAELENLYIWSTVRTKVKGKQGLLANLKNVTKHIEYLDFAIETTQLHQWIDKLTQYRGTRLLTKDDSAELRETIKCWRVLVEKELFDKPIIEVSARNLQPKDIAAGPMSFVKPEIWRRLSRIARSGLSDATKCLATGAHTAAAMVCFRVTEDIVRRYFKFKTGKKPPKSWKELLDILSKRQNIRHSLIGHLNYLRDRRNEAEHPERTFHQEEAERIFMAVIDLAHEIYSEIPTQKRA